MIAIINYGMGNLRSVFNAFSVLGADARILDGPEELREAERIVLPGVGAFGDAMHNLRKRGWIEALEEEVLLKEKPYLGICLGLQLLATVGLEHGTHLGLSWISGVVEKIQCDDPDLRVPHIGWNDVYFRKDEGLSGGLGEKNTFYFLHSYVFKPEDASVIDGTCHYGIEFVASIEKGNIWGTQFHPEKSQKAGLKVLQNFVHIGR
ncbi:MAG: imidazole glycerol phosphate synthase subunit HisH [Desulfobacteraceae bacterium]|jgi:glutamine amidotransferase